MRVQMRFGTPTSHKDNLCEKCNHFRIRQYDNGEFSRQCSVGDERSAWAHVQLPVVECSVFQKSGDQSLGAMFSLAWSFARNRNGEITFVDSNTMPVEYESRSLTKWQKFVNWILRRS